MRFIHTADIRLDRCYAEQELPAHAGRENRGHLRTRLESLLERAAAWPADAVLIAGNLIEFESFDRDTIAFLREAFQRVAPIPIIIAPGHCDPFTATSPYATELWPENVHIFRGPGWECTAVGEVRVCGFASDGRDFTSDPFESFAAPEGDAPVVIVASAWATCLGDCPVPGRAAVDLGHLGGVRPAYVALGQVPDCMPLECGDGLTAWYSGAPEGGSYGETGPHHYLEVEIAPCETGGHYAARVTQVPVSAGRFFEMRLDCTDLASGQALIDAVRPHLAANPDRQCARVVLEGALLPEIYDEMASIRDALSEEVLHLDLVDRCFVAENFGALAAEQTSLGAFVARINREIEDAPDEVLRAALCRSRDLALCAYRGQHLPIRASQGD